MQREKYIGKVYKFDQGGFFLNGIKPKCPDYL